MTQTSENRDPLIAHLDAIDAAWNERRPIDVRRLLDSLGSSITLSDQADLLAADLEWRWRAAGMTYRMEAAPAEHNDYREGLQPKPVEEYAATFPEILATPAIMRKLVVAEFVARSRWNNPPLIERFAERFEALDGLRSTLLASLDDVAVLQAVVQAGEGTVDRYPVGGCGEIGRARRGESVGCTMLGEHQRLVIAEAHTDTISRNQAGWRRISLDRADIENTSRKITMHVAGRLLPPGGRRSEWLPLSIAIHPLRVSLELAF